MKCRNIIIGVLSLTLAVSAVCVPATSSRNAITITSAAADVELDPDIEYVNCRDHIEITGFHSQKYCLEIPDEIEGLPVTKIVDRACKGNVNLCEVFLPDRIEEIGDEAFAGCDYLQEFHFSPVIKSIGAKAFYGCIRLKVIIVPDTVSEIGDEAFAKCQILQNIILPDRLSRIGEGMFADDALLDTVCIPAGVERIERNAFRNCSGLKYVCYKGSADAWALLSVGSENDTLTSASILCDYNKVKLERDHMFDPEKDRWGFLNKDVGYYVLSDEKMSEMTKGMSETEIAKIKSIWNQIKDKEYLGSCAGIAITSLLAAAGILDPADLDSDAKYLCDVELTDDVRELLTYYLVLQTSDSFYECDIWSDFKLYYYLEKHIPVYFSYSTTLPDEEGHMSFFGHAVVAYGVEDGHYEFDGTVFTKKILTYDSNISADSDEDGCIYWGVESSETGFPEGMIYVPYIAKRGNGRIFPDPMAYNLDALNLHGLNRGTAYEEPQNKCALIRSPQFPSNYKIMSYLPRNPEKQNTAEYEKKLAGAFQAISCADGESGYVLEMQDKQPLNCSMSYENWLYSVNGSDMTSATFEPDGSVSLSGENMEYQLSIVANEEHPTSYYELCISGANSDAVKVQQSDGGYLISGTDLREVTVDALNDSQQLSLTFSTDADHVLVHETDSHTLAVSADLDDDGTFETVLTSGTVPGLGDVNDDGSINAKDANEVLIAAARIGTGKASGLTETQQKAADVDQDGNINAEDAAWILRYAAAAGTTSSPSMLEEFMEKYAS